MTQLEFNEKWGTDTWRIGLRSGNKKLITEIIDDLKSVMDFDPLLDLVHKMTGPIDPVGECHIDTDRLVNLLARIKLMKALHMEVDAVACGSKSHMDSVKKAGLTAAAYLDWLGIED